MIIGIGIDNVELARIEKALARSKSFVSRVLTEKEQLTADSFSGLRLTEFIAGRWAAKEAFAKAIGTGFRGQFTMQSLEIAADKFGKPYFVQSSADGRVHLSISHSRSEAVAVVIIESLEEMK